MSFFLQRLPARLRVGPIAGSMLELGALGVLVLVAWDATGLAGRLSRDTGQFLWLARGPIAAPAFAYFIAVMASERGLLSQSLGHRLPVRLGEISYALYLVHYPLLKLAWSEYPDAASGPGLILPLAQLLLCSQLLWLCVETPARRFLTARHPMSRRRARGAAAPEPERGARRRTALACALVFGLLLVGQRIREAP